MEINMLHSANRQLQPISIEQIKDILKENANPEFNKMIISNGTEIKRADYYYSIFQYKKAKRNLISIAFPLFDSIKNVFSLFEGGIAKFGEKCIVENENYIYEFLKLKGSKISEIELNGAGNDLVFPFDERNDEVSPLQRKYFLPKHTFLETCNKCNGFKYVKCTDNECNGRHNWQCKDCAGKGQIPCLKCKGHGYIKCNACSGKGTIEKTEYKNGKPYQRTEKCSNCRGRGEVPCSNCSTTGKVQCKTCSGYGNITCKVCHSDALRKGTIDCPECLTAGTIGKFVYVETIIEDLNTTRLLSTGDDVAIGNDSVASHIKNEVNTIGMYNKVNERIFDEPDAISEKLIETYEYELGLAKTGFPMVLKEEIFYQVIPVVEISYKHMLTNEFHNLTIVDVWDNPEIFFHSDAEKLNISVKSVSTAIGGMFSKVFKTKGHYEKEDRKTEIKLMIYIARSDGKIEEQEKEFISEQISQSNGFTNSDKKELFNLMNSIELPELTRNDVKLSSPDREIEIIDKLTQLANSDGELEETEYQLIEKIKSFFSLQ